MAGTTVMVDMATVEAKAVMVVPHKVVAEAVVVEVAAAAEVVAAVAEDPAHTKHSLSYSYVTVYDSCSMTHHFEQHYCPFLIRLHLHVHYYTTFRISVCYSNKKSECHAVSSALTSKKIKICLIHYRCESKGNLF